MSEPVNCVNMTDEEMYNLERELRILIETIAVEQNFKTSIYYDLLWITLEYSGQGNSNSKLFNGYISGDGRDPLSLTFKAAPIGKKVRGQTPAKPHDRERIVYTELIKSYRELEEEHCLPEEHKLKHPTYYGSHVVRNQDVLVIEDLAGEGFGPANRFESVNWEYATAAVTELAKLHALSIAYEHQYPSKFDNTLHKLASERFTENEDTKELFADLVKKTLATVREQHKEKMKSYLDGKSMVTYGDMFRALRRKVIIHADFWPSNMLHRVKEDGTTEVTLVDFQTIQGGSPVVDLLYFIFTATDRQFRAQHYQELIDHYHSELGAALARLGLDVEDKYSREDFDYEIKEKLSIGLLTLVFVLSSATEPEDNSPALEDESKIMMESVNSNVELQSLNTGASNEGTQYPQRLNEVVDWFVALGLL